MRFNDDMDLVRALSEISYLTWSHDHSLPTAIDQTLDRIQRIASDAISYTLRRMVEEAKASADETVSLIRRR